MLVCVRLLVSEKLKCVCTMSLCAGKDRSQVSRIKKLKRRISASFGRLCEYYFISMCVCVCVCAPELAYCECKGRSNLSHISLSLPTFPSLNARESKANRYKRVCFVKSLSLSLSLSLAWLDCLRYPSQPSLCAVYVVSILSLALPKSF